MSFELVAHSRTKKQDKADQDAFVTINMTVLRELLDYRWRQMIIKNPCARKTKRTRKLESSEEPKVIRQVRVLKTRLTVEMKEVKKQPNCRLPRTKADILAWLGGS